MAAARQLSGSARHAAYAAGQAAVVAHVAAHELGAAAYALELGLVVATDGTANAVNGNATVRGTVSCTKATSVSLNGSVTQVNKALLTRGTFSTQVARTPGSSVPWTATAIPSGLTAFVKGAAEATTQADGFDADYDQDVVQNKTTVVKLNKARP